MIQNKITTIDVKEVENQKFEITFTRVDVADAEDVLKNIENLRQAINTDKDNLESVDAKIADQKKQMTANITTNLNLLDKFASAEATAKLWAKANELKNERAGKEAPTEDSPIVKLSQ